MKFSLCSSCMDSHDHLFFQCSFSSAIWVIVKGKSYIDNLKSNWDDSVSSMALFNKKAIKDIVRILVFGALIGESNSRLRVEKSRPKAFETMAELSSLYIGVLLGINELLEKIIGYVVDSGGVLELDPKEKGNKDGEFPDDEIRLVGDKLKETEDKIKEGTLKVDQGTDAMTVVIGKKKEGYARGVGSGVMYEMYFDLPRRQTCMDECIVLLLKCSADEVGRNTSCWMMRMMASIQKSNVTCNSFAKWIDGNFGMATGIVNLKGIRKEANSHTKDMKSDQCRPFTEWKAASTRARNRSRTEMASITWS
ncbi:hypothetical protein Tco_0606488 [Tanacetum coccineum]